MDFDYFRGEYIPQEVLIKIKDKSITHNIFRIQDCDSIICMITRKTLIDYTNFFYFFKLLLLATTKRNIRQDISTLNKNMAKENASLNFTVKLLIETRNFILDEIKCNELFSEKHKKGYSSLHFYEHFLYLFPLPLVLFQFLHLFH